MSLQAHTDSSVAPPVAERVPLPELPSRLYHQLVKVAARYAVPLDDLIEYIVAEPAPSFGDLVKKRADARAHERAVSEAGMPRWVCRHGGRCPAAFMWRGALRCGCGPVRGAPIQ